MDGLHVFLVIGDGGVGKTSLTRTFCTGLFVEEYDPTIEDAYRKACRVDEQDATVEVQDLSGLDNYNDMVKQFANACTGVMLVYSVTDRKSFENLAAHRDLVLSVKKLPMLLVGNKCDLETERAVLKEDAEVLARAMGMRLFETSAKQVKNVKEAFTELVREERKVRAGANGRGAANGKCHVQ